MSNLMVSLDCVKRDKDCHKIAMVMDKDILDQRKAEIIVSICQRCTEREEK